MDRRAARCEAMRLLDDMIDDRLSSGSIREDCIEGTGDAVSKHKRKGKTCDDCGRVERELREIQRWVRDRTL